MTTAKKRTYRMSKKEKQNEENRSSAWMKIQKSLEPNEKVSLLIDLEFKKYNVKYSKIRLK